MGSAPPFLIFPVTPYRHPRDALLGDDYSQEQWDKRGELWSLNEPLYIQYARFVRNALTGNFGDSIRNQG